MLIKDSDGDKFEDSRSLIQELTFVDAQSELKKRDVVFEEVQMKTLGLTNIDNIYTNLALLLSDQCMHTIKAAVFSGPEKTTFKDRREFSGSILKQLSNVYDYVDIYNKNNAEFVGLERIDSRDYPEAAIREALLNALVHRDYSYSGSTLINIYSNRIEFVSIGGLVKSLTLNDLMLGISQPRNEKLAAIFYRLKLIESYGTGIIKIFDCYKKAINKPELKASENAFVISLPNLNEQSIKGIHKPNKGIPKPNDKTLLDYLDSKGSLKRKDAEKLLDIGQTSAGKVLAEMVKENKIQICGSGRNTLYILPDDDQ